MRKKVICYLKTVTKKKLRARWSLIFDLGLK